MSVNSIPCCDYRDHSSGACACPEHPRSVLHPFGRELTEGEQAEREALAEAVSAYNESTRSYRDLGWG